MHLLGVAKRQRGEFLDATKGEGGVGVIVGCLGGDSIALGASNCQVGIVQINRLTTRIMIAEFEIRQNMFTNCRSFSRFGTRAWSTSPGYENGLRIGSPYPGLPYTDWSWEKPPAHS
eukprot:6195787-Pleurochrysis_carterae.AAC.1